MIFSETSSLGKLWLRLVHPKARAYKECFNTPAGQAVLTDLAPVCFANAATTTERQAGARDVWLRINQFLAMREEDLTILTAQLGPEARYQLWNPSATYHSEGEH